MSEIRITYPLDPKLNFDCKKIHLESYTLQEVLLPPGRDGEVRRAIAITIKGNNLEAVAQPLTATVGKVPVSYLRIAPDEKSIEGILLEEPEEDGNVDVILGDQDHARHPKPFKKSMVKRIQETK